MIVMKRCFFVFALLLGLVAMPSSRAQYVDTIDVPMGCFEVWNQYPGDSLMLMGYPIPVNNSYQLPEGWGVPKYFIDDTVSYMSLVLPISANVPVAKTYPDTVNAPQGSSALVAESFVLSDIMSPAVYSMAGSLLDSSLTGTVLPTVVATAELDLNKAMPLLERLMESDHGEMNWLLELSDSVDLNEYIQGGFPLDGFQPDKILGYYKYISASIGPWPDNGAVVALGTRYDTLTHRRMLVGAGSKNLFQLYDTVVYEPFEMDYFSIGDYLPTGYEYSDADTLILMIISSASEKQFWRGSRLFVDSLRLMRLPGPCGRINNFAASSHGPSWVYLTWNNTATPDHWEVEYGVSGFVQGRGTVQTVSDSSTYIINLDPLTEYDFYVRGKCGDSATTPWVYVSCMTDSVPHHDEEGIDYAEGNTIKIYPNPTQGRCIVDMQGQSVKALKLYGIEGRLLQTVDVKEDKVELTLPSRGMYFVEISTGNGSVYQKVICE